jgi:hypothetical protein
MNILSCGRAVEEIDTWCSDPSNRRVSPDRTECCLADTRLPRVDSPELGVRREYNADALDLRRANHRELTVLSRAAPMGGPVDGTIVSRL